MNVSQHKSLQKTSYKYASLPLYIHFKNRMETCDSKLWIWSGPAKICEFPGGILSVFQCGPDWGRCSWVYTDKRVLVELWRVDLSCGAGTKVIRVQETDGLPIQQCKPMGCLWKKRIQEIIKSNRLLLRGNYWLSFQSFGLSSPTSVAFAVLPLCSWWQIEQDQRSAW